MPGFDDIPAGAPSDQPQGAASADALAPQQSSVGDIPGGTADPNAPSDAFQQGYEAAQQYGGRMQAINKGIEHGIIGNLSDRALSTIAGAGSFLTGHGFSEGYNRDADYSDGYAKALGEMYPASSIGGILMGSLVPAVPASKLITGATLIPRVAQSAGVAAGLGAAEGFASGSGWDQRVQDAKNGAFWGGLLGAGAEGLTGAVSAAWPKLFGARTNIAPGVNPAARAAEGNRFGLDLTRGQATGDVPQQGWEEAARKGAHGPEAQQIMLQRQEEQQAAMQAAPGTIVPRQSPQQAGETIQQGLTKTVGDLRQQASDIYNSPGMKTTLIHQSAIEDLVPKVAQELQSQGFDLAQPGAFPNATAAMKQLEWIRDNAASDTSAVSDAARSIAGLDRASQRINQIYSASARQGGTDYLVTGIIRRNFNKWLSDAVDNSLFTGDPDALKQLAKARQLVSQYKSFEDPETAFSAFDKIVNGAKDLSTGETYPVSGEQVANLLTGMNTVGAADKSARLAAYLRDNLDKIAGTPGSYASTPEWQALRGAVWDRTVEPAHGKGGPQALATSIDRLLTGSGRPLAEVLYTPQEIANMQAFSNAVKHLIPSPDITNPPKSGFTAWRLIRNGLANHFSGIASGAVLGALTEHQSGGEGYKGMITGALLGAAGQSVLRARPGMMANSALQALPGTAARSATARIPTMMGAEYTGDIPGPFQQGGEVSQYSVRQGESRQPIDMMRPQNDMASVPSHWYPFSQYHLNPLHDIAGMVRAQMQPQRPNADSDYRGGPDDYKEGGNVHVNPSMLRLKALADNIKRRRYGAFASMQRLGIEVPDRTPLFRFVRADNGDVHVGDANEMTHNGIIDTMPDAGYIRKMAYKAAPMGGGRLGFIHEDHFPEIEEAGGIKNWVAGLDAQKNYGAAWKRGGKATRALRLARQQGGEVDAMEMDPSGPASDYGLSQHAISQTTDNLRNLINYASAPTDIMARELLGGMPSAMQPSHQYANRLPNGVIVSHPGYLDDPTPVEKIRARWPR